MILQSLLSFCLFSWFPSRAECRDALKDFVERTYNEMIYIAKTGDTRNLYKFGEKDTTHIRKSIQEEIDRRGIDAYINNIEQRKKEFLSEIKKAQIKYADENCDLFRINISLDSFEAYITTVPDSPFVRVCHMYTFSPKQSIPIEDYTKIDHKTYAEEQQKKQEPTYQQEQQREEQGPRIVGMGEWINADGLEYIVNSVKKVAYTQGDLWKACMKTEPGKDWYQVHSDFIVLNVAAKGNTTEQNWAKFNLPLEIDGNLYCIEQGLGEGSTTFAPDLYSILNNEELRDAGSNVTKYTSATRQLPYEIRRWTTGDPRYGKLGQFMPKGIARLKVGENVYIEVGNSSDW